jgi:ketosteroid isomerase-like protein
MMTPRIALTLIGLALAACVALAAGATAPAMDDPRAVLTAMARAVNAGDARGYADLYAPDAVITIHGGGTLQGRDAIRAHEESLMGQFPGARLGFYDVWQNGSLTVAHYVVNGTSPGGPSMGHEGLLFFRFHPSGLIREEFRYHDSLTPMAQLGALGDRPARPLPPVPETSRWHTAEKTAAEQENVARVRALFRALDARDHATFLSGFAEDAVVDEMIDLQSFTGLQGVRAWLDRWTAAVPDARHEIGTVLGIGDAVLVETIVRGTLEGALGPLSGSARAFTAHRAAIFRLAEDRVTRVTAFVNGKELAQATEQWPLAPGK